MNKQEAQALTARIKSKLYDSGLIEDITTAYRERVWLALDYPTWGDWCDGELGGFKLPTPQRKSVVADLAGEGMSDRAIADVIGASRETVRRERSSDTNVSLDREVLGQDGRSRSYPAKREPAPEFLEQEDVSYSEPEPMARRQIMAMMAEELDLMTQLSKLEELCHAARLLAKEVAAQGPFGDPAYTSRLNAASAALSDAQWDIAATIVEVTT